MSDSDSDYVVEEFVKPDKIGIRPINDESADLLGNFDDNKRKQIATGTKFEEDPFKDPDEEDDNNEMSDDEQDDKSKNDDEDSDDSDEETINGNKDAGTVKKTLKKSLEPHLEDDQINSLMRGVSKSNRHVVYVTNLNFATTKDRLAEFFGSCGEVKGVRIPKKRKGGFAFVEMMDMNGFKKALTRHNTVLDDRPIKIQLSEAGKRKSANKKNILKQKNRKLAQLRNETKKFTKSGKNYDKSIKKEIAKEQLIRTQTRARRKNRQQRKLLNN